MNNKADELKLKSTHFITPHGLDNDEHYTTAYDLAILTNYALQNHIFSKIVKTKTYTININGSPKNISNTNELLGNLDGVYGVKTGFTNGANRCLVTSCKRGDLDIICVVLGCDTKKFRTQDSIKLINYVFKNFVVVNIEEFIDKNFEEWKLLHSSTFTIDKGYSQILDLHLGKASMSYSSLAINKSDLDKISTYISYTSSYKAPIPENSIIGTLDLRINNTTHFTLNIINSNFVQKKSVFYYFYTLISNYFKYIKTT